MACKHDTRLLLAAAEIVTAQSVCGTDDVADAACTLQMALKCMQEHNVASCRCHAEGVSSNIQYLAAALLATS